MISNNNDTMFGTYEKVSRLDQPCVLWRDYHGFYAPLVSMYWSTSSLILVSRHPFNCIEEIISIYCPQCLTRHTDDDRILQSRCSTCFECPICYGIQILKSKQLHDNRSFLCHSCGWQSKDESTINTDDLACHTVTASNAFHQLMNQKLYSESTNSMSDERMNGMKNTVCRSKSAEGIHRWQWADLDASLASKALSNGTMEPTKLSADTLSSTIEHSITKTSALLDVVSHRMQCPDLDSSLLSSLRPRRVKLQSKRLIRCRKDVEEGKMNILLQPNKAPLDGDTYSVTSRGKSSFFVKDSSAVHELPNVVITSLLDTQCSMDLRNGQSITLEITITNPKVTRVRICMSIDSSYSSSSTTTSSYSETAAFNAKNVLWLDCGGSVEDGDQSNMVAEFTLGGYEDELLRDNSDEESSGIHSTSSTGQHLTSDHEQTRRFPSSSWTISHNVAILTMSVNHRIGLGTTTTNTSSINDSDITMGVLPLVMSIEDLDTTTKSTVRDFQVLVAFPISVS